MMNRMFGLAANPFNAKTPRAQSSAKPGGFMAEN
jgi:hypothetical protein